MKTKTLFSKALAAVLALLMLVGILPTVAFAAEDEESGIASQAVETEDVIRLPITIRDANRDGLFFENTQYGRALGDVQVTLGKDGVPQYTEDAIKKLAQKILSMDSSDYGYNSTDAQKPYQALTGLILELSKGENWRKSYNGNSWVDSWNRRTATANRNWNWNPEKERVEKLENAQTVSAVADWMLRHAFVDGSFTYQGDSYPYTATYNGYENLVLQPGIYNDTACYYYNSAESTVFDYADSAANSVGEIYNGGSNTVYHGGWFPLDHMGERTNPNAAPFDVSHNYHTTTQGSGQFVYHKEDNLFFAFTGDDDVYLYINGKLVIDDGGTHERDKAYVYLEQAVGSGEFVYKYSDATEGKTWAEYLGLKEGETYTFDFFQMERRTNYSNFAIWTNIKVVNSSAVPNKKAYQNGRELIYGSFVPQNSEVTYGFELTNDGNGTVTYLTFKDDLLGVYLTAIEGETLNLGANAVTDLEYAIFANGGTPSYTKLTTEDQLKSLLADGIVAGKTISIRGFKYNVGTPDEGATTKTISNTVYTTALGKSKTGADMTISGSASMRIRTWNINNVAFVMDYAKQMSLSNKDVFGGELTALSQSTTITDEDNTSTTIQLKDEVGNVKLDSEKGLYGTMKMTGSAIADYALKYTPNSILNGIDSFTVQITVDTTTTVNNVSTSGSNIMNKSVSIIPANNVYYEDTFVSTTKATTDTGVDENSVQIVYNGNNTTSSGNTESAEIDEEGVGAGIHGWEDSLADDTGYSDGSATKMTTGATATFTFTGTGVDIYSYTDMTTGIVTAKIVSESGTASTKYLMVDNLAVSGQYYQIPTLSFQDLDYGTYTVTLVVNNAKAPVTEDDSVKVDEHGDIVYSETATRNTYYLDGIRVYNPIQNLEDTDTVKNAYGADELNAVFEEVRDLMAADTATDSEQGKVFIDLDGSGKVSDATAYDASEYGTYGPKNEVYLDPGQSITFKVADASASYQIGLKAPDGKGTNATFNNGTENNEATIGHTTDLYYKIVPSTIEGGSGYITIKNSGGNLLSVTKIKMVSATSGASIMLLEMTEEEASNEVAAFSLRSTVAYSAAPEEEVTPPEAPEAPTVPETPTEPDIDVDIDNHPEPEQKPEEKPSQNDALKDLIKSLFDKIFGWFGRRSGGIKMKNQYVKPVLVIENFTLSQSIAYNCGKSLNWNQATTKDVNSCGWNTGFPGEVVFMVPSSVCNVKDEDFDGVCYNNPDGGINVFSS